MVLVPVLVREGFQPRIINSRAKHFPKSGVGLKPEARARTEAQMKHPIQHPTKQTLEQQLENPQTLKSQPNETKAVDTTGESTEPGSAEEESFPEKKSSATYASLLSLLP